MNKHITRVLLLSGCALALASCDENSWNDKLDGFEEKNEVNSPSNVQTINYTLSDYDYSLVASNSTNVALAGDADKAALSALKSTLCFTEVITPEKYIPALLSDPKFRYFALSNGSAIKVTFNYAAGQPAEVTALSNATTYTVTEADYQKIWGSDVDFANAFAPSKPAARNIPGILADKINGAELNQYAVVTYNETSTDPDFGTVEAPFEQSSTLGSIALNSTVEANAVVMAVSAQGPIVADASGALFAYRPSNNNDLKVGDQVSFSGSVSSYNYGYQLASGITLDVKGSQTPSYPAAKTWTPSEIDQFVADAMASGAKPIAPVYSKFTGKVTVSGSYINIILDGTSVQVSPYGATSAVKAALTDGATVTFEGYVMALASKGKYLNTVITKVGDTNITTQTVKMDSRAGVNVQSTTLTAVYKFTSSGWAVADETVALSHGDYQAMGQKYDNLSGELPATMLPIFLKNKYPYAVADQEIFVVYNYYNGSATVLRAEKYLYDGSTWKADDGIVQQTAQFVKNNGKWNFDPSTVINLPAGKGIEISTLYYQTCVDWIAANVPGGANYVTSYGNNEYYCGTSAYQGNVDIRPGSARNQYEAGYEGMTDDEIVALMKQRFESEVLPAALAILHPDAIPVAGVTVTYTVNFYYYNGSTHAATAVYEVTAPATFTFVSCTWNDTADE